MKLKVLAVYDAAVAAYTNPFYMQSIGEAKRGWIEVSNDNTTKFFKYPSEYTLFHIADFDAISGKFENLHTPESLGTALQAKSHK